MIHVNIYSKFYIGVEDAKYDKKYRNIILFKLTQGAGT